jgi:transketolase
MVTKEIAQTSVNTIRFLAVDGVQKANSGHPGLPMGTAAMAYVLWTRHLMHNPSNPDWADRDRFVLSAGHGSMLLYGLLHLTGYDLPMEQLQQFRQWDSLTPGHPESHLTPGVEVTSGPLGQGFANGVGMAIAERFLAERFNTPEFTIVDHHIYAIVSDGDLEEGVSAEAASLAGTLKLGKLIYLYDDNQISIEGDTDIAFTEDVGARFRAYDWHVQGPIDGNDLDAIDEAIKAAQADTARPSLIICTTQIGYGSPNKQGTASVHGEPLGPDEVKLTKENLGWPVEPAFYVPDEALEHFREAVDAGKVAEADWQARFDTYARAHPDEAAEFERRQRGELPDNWDAALPTYTPDDGPVATRAVGGKVLNAIFENLPDLIGGSADLAPSTKTLLDGVGDFHFDERGHNMHFGVREHAMGSIAVGMARHGGVIPYTATFLVFVDYMRPPVRLAALGEDRVIFIYTHDSIGLGEDGPTHQPVEHLALLRATPNVTLIRPADANETAEAWRQAILNTHGPTAIALTRQKLPVFDQLKYGPASGVARGAYVLEDSEQEAPDLILMASGSEVHLALEAAGKLNESGIAVRVVSMPSWELFDAQPQDYRDLVLPPEVTARLAIEAAVSMGWHKYVGGVGDIVALDRFGASAPGGVVMDRLGFNVDNVVARAKALL